MLTIIAVILLFIMVFVFIIIPFKKREEVEPRDKWNQMTLDHPTYFKYITNSTENVFKTIGIKIVGEKVNSEYIPLRCFLRGIDKEGKEVTVDMNNLTEATEEEYNDNKKEELKELGL